MNKRIIIIVIQILAINALAEKSMSNEPTSAPSSNIGKVRYDKEHDQNDAVSPMDDAYYTSFYKYICGDVNSAFMLLDNAISKHPPSSNWYLYLPLYRRCVYLLTGTQPEEKEHREFTKKYIETLDKIKSQKVRILVKQAVLVPIGDDTQKSTIILKRIQNKHKNSLWSKWAHWQLIVNSIKQKATRLSREGFSNTLEANLLSRKLMISIQAGSIQSDGDIIHKWAIRMLARSIGMASFDMKCFSDALIKIRNNISTDEKTLVCTTNVHNLLPISMIYDQRILDIIEGSYHHPTITPQEIVWQYYEQLRKTNNHIPNSIPKNKSEFMSQSSKFIKKIREVKAKDISQIKN